MILRQRNVSVPGSEFEQEHCIVGCGRECSRNFGENRRFVLERDDVSRSIDGDEYVGVSRELSSSESRRADGENKNRTTCLQGDGCSAAKVWGGTCL
jgi:hypothetical protein